jgi:hypothetical protein
MIGGVERELSACGPADAAGEAWTLIARRHAVE